MIPFLVDKISKALAEIVDEDIIYGCDDKAVRWHNRLMKQEFSEKLRKIKPKWIPKFVWDKIIRNAN